MSKPLEIPHQIRPEKGLELPSSPSRTSFGSPGKYYQIPSPIITRRTRTFSLSEQAASNPVQHGKVKYFCRQKGHGFIRPDDGSEDIFFHISDIEGEYAPRRDDEVTYKLCLVPPKNEKVQATHVIITSLGPGTHERWDQPPSPVPKEEEAGNHT
ncbi:cold shock domain-containing protein CG9705-like [Limulus polyphemus]|uniref:Cold shock domain-containing protein CG9705-like n=1 Tax=Limulus polyphemus TaxID=6850 RepID=A0ABM1B948_LIMPO|nr:cold shock domain-containing protein CG9705-like [Limulus polyphemus]XP_022244832.1 cold shock domain-containing protein CG9705-like [Limulus polyphemus]XP_022244833.1 cold shock domain-containing protein CG9705-like [Limulus polyphemus]